MARPSALFSRRIITHYKRDVRDSRGASETGRLLRTLAGRRRAPRWGTNTCCTVVRIAEEPRRNVRLTTQRRQQLHDRWLQTTADRTGRRFLASVAALQSDFFVSHQRTGHYCPTVCLQSFARFRRLIHFLLTQIHLGLRLTQLSANHTFFPRLKDHILPVLK